MMHKAMLAAFSVLLWAGSASATDMKLLSIGASADAQSWGFVDLAGVDVSGSARTYWVLWANTGAQAALPGHISYEMARYTDDCDAHTSLFTYVAVYDRDGRELRHAFHRVGAVPAAASTAGAQIQRLVCNADTPVTDRTFASVGEALQWARSQKK